MAADTGRRFTDDAGNGTTIGKGITVEGTISGPAPVEISGTVDGTIRVDALVWVREGGRVKGEIKATGAVVEGRLDGAVEAREKVELRAHCKVRGDVDTKSLAIAEGAFFEGSIKMSGGSAGSTSFKEKRSGG